jgi:peptidoglycan/LPS O-acetylase OafA/YrhL
MQTVAPKYSYLLAILFGLVAFFIPVTEPVPLYLILFYLLGGGIFGFLFPFKSWRWGLWISAPMLAILGLSLLFAGQLQVFIKNDLPILLLVVLSSCLGSFIAAYFKSRLRDSRI